MLRTIKDKSMWNFLTKLRATRKRTDIGAPDRADIQHLEPIEDNDIPNINEIRCVTLRDGFIVRISAELVTVNRLIIIASYEDGEMLDYGIGASPHLSLSRSQMGTNINSWIPEHVYMLGAQHNNGLSTALLDFAADVVNLNLVLPNALNPAMNEAQEWFNQWQERRMSSRTNFVRFNR
jgi:hypothetical protein